jgi:asparagine synthetase B (glutamine-hydrolysing)
VCGIFAFAGPAGPDPDVLAEASRSAAQRGPHAHGWLARHADDKTTTTVHRQLGPAYACPGEGCRLGERTEPRILGHSRLATFGAPDDLAGVQPLAQDGHVLCHNGNAYNAAEIDSRLAKVSDSAVLLALYAAVRATGSTPSEALQGVVNVADQKAWALVVLDLTGELVAHRHGLPLFRLTHPTGVYLSSVAFAGAEELPADTILREAPPL